MAYLVVNPNGDEFITTSKPFKSDKTRPLTEYRRSQYNWQTTGNFIKLPKGSIRKLIGKELTTIDEPVKI